MRFVWLLTLLFAPPALADSWRCGSKLVSVGDRAFEVLAKCGKPTHRELISPSYYHSDPIVEQWIYGPRNGSYRLLTFDANRLVRIEFIRQ